MVVTFNIVVAAPSVGYVGLAIKRFSEIFISHLTTPKSYFRAHGFLRLISLHTKALK